MYTEWRYVVVLGRWRSTAVLPEKGIRQCQMPSHGNRGDSKTRGWLDASGQKRGAEESKVAGTPRECGHLPKRKCASELYCRGKAI